MKKRFFILVIIIAGLLFAAKHFLFKDDSSHGTGMERPPAKVTLAEVKQEEITDTKKYIGRIAAKDTVKVIPRIKGYVKKKCVHSDALVNKGDLLCLIDPEKYEAAVAQTKAIVEKAKASLWESEKNLERAKELVEKDYISKSEYDTKLAIRDKNKAVLEAARANLKKANDDLRYTKIYATMTGKIGHFAAEGNLVGPTKGPVTTIVRIDPIYAIYNIPAEEFTKLRLKLVEKGKDIDKGKIKIELPDGTPYPIEGKQYSYHNIVDETTGTLKIKTIFRNTKGILIPGTFVNVIVYEGKPVKNTVIPQAAVLEDSEGKYVYVVDDKNTAQIRRIKTGKQIDTNWTVEKGLKPGEKIILEGLQKVQPNAKVMPTPPEIKQSAEIKKKEPADVQ